MIPLMELVIFLVAQSVVIVGAIVTVHVRTQVAIAALNVHVEHVQETTAELKEDQKDLTHKVDGISRHVAKIEAGCKFMKRST